MRLSKLLSCAGLIATLAACGSGAERSARTADDADLAEGEGEEKLERSARRARAERARQRKRAREARALTDSLPPADCEDGAECLPPAKWVSRLCQGVHPEVALHMFRGGSPWTRLYSRHTAPAFNGAGGPSMPDERVARGEELIALRRNTDGKPSSSGEMSVGDTAGYDLLRWNGTCVTLHDGEFSTKPPRRRKHARVEWKLLGDEVQSVLRTDSIVRRAVVQRRKECKGATIGRVTKKCVEQDNSLVSAIVQYVRDGGELPEPSERL